MEQETNTFLLSPDFEKALNIVSLKKVTKLYYQSFKDFPFTIPKTETLAFMLFAKREKIAFGPYNNLSFYEISNRIHSDLVLLEASKLLFIEHHIKSVTLKMSNQAGHDILAIDKNDNEIIGEAFNTASSYFQIKMRSELKKFGDNRKGIIAFNKTALSGNKNWFEGKKNEFSNITFIVCEEENINSLTTGL